ncbi:MAG: hypothetical protein U1C33_05115, partial [Candidatus Cloacimonadaceae bacterium]|nr:hypothetical protein [Candidatus Cloacimonadaceae bacterium]
MKRMVLAMAVLIALLVSACERDRDNNRYMTKLLHLEMDISGNISAENFPGFYSTVFGKPQWIRDDYLLFSKAKLYRGSWDAVDMIQLLPDSIDCFGYNISVSTSRERIWFCNAQGVWSCNFSGGDITHVYPSPMDVMQLSNRENYLVGVNMNDRSGLRLLDLATNTMEEHNAMGTIIKAFYNEDLGKFSYLTNLTNGKGV